MGKEKTPQLVRKQKIISAFYKNYFHSLMGLDLYSTLYEANTDEVVAITFAKICRYPMNKLEDMSTW